MLYPCIEPHSQGLLDVGDGHQMYWEECGNPLGLPVVFLHGGPGAGCTSTSRRFFDPLNFRIILFDQRGCGRSLPHASTHHNFLANLVADMEQLRSFLCVDRWWLLGGSWGCTLALAYARVHGRHVMGMVLRGVFTARRLELEWLYREGGASRLFPEAWSAFTNAIQHTVEPVQGRWLTAYAKQFQNQDMPAQLCAALAWCQWEDTLSSLDTQEVGDLDPLRCLAMARISSHLFTNDPDLQAGLGLDEAGGMQYLSGIPGVLVQGRYDMVTPFITAWQLHRSWPESQLRTVYNAGHSSSDGALQQVLVETLDSLIFRETSFNKETTWQ